MVRWEPPPKDGQNGVITGYKLRYKKQTRRDGGDRGYTVTAAGDRRLHVLSNLEKGSVYQVRKIVYYNLENEVSRNFL